VESKPAPTAALPSNGEPAYLVQTGTDSNGPFPVNKIRELHRRGAIDDDTPVVLQGGREWKKVREVIG
jgi:hypothetical protein